MPNFSASKKYLYSCFILVFALSLALFSSQANAGQRSRIHEDESIAITKRLPIREFVGAVAGLIPAIPECGDSTVHGIGGVLSPTPSSPMEYPVIGNIIIGRIPVHIVRLTQLDEISRDCMSNLRKQYGENWPRFFAAKIAHAVVNHVLPITYMSFMAQMSVTAEPYLIPFTAITLPPLMLSYYLKGLEVSPDEIPLTIEPYTLPIVATGFAARGLVVQKIVENTLQHNDPMTRAAVSWGAGMASVGLSYMFDRNKLAQYINMLKEHSIGVYAANYQAVLITSAYYGFTKSLQISSTLGINQNVLPFLAVSYLALETATEVVSISNNFKHVQRKFARWWNPRGPN